MSADPGTVAPYLRLEARPGGVRVRGRTEAAFGHESADGQGVFARWRWDGERLLVRNDRYGMWPLFYRHEESALTVSPDVRVLLALGGPAEPDHDALAVFLRLGFFLAEDTPFAGVRALPPAATLTWSAGRLGLASGRMPPAGPAATTRRAAVDGFVELFRDAVARRLPDEPYVLPLSGGRDSRHILLELHRQGAPPRLCVSGAKFPPDPGADAKVAAVLAARLGVEHRVLRRRRSQFRAEVAANPAQSMCTVEGAWALPVLAYLRARTRVSFDGIGGGELAQNPSMELIRANPFDPDDLPGVADRMLLAGRTGPHVEHLLSPRLAGLWSRERARAHLVAELERHAGAAFPYASFYFWNRTRRAIAMTPYGLLRDGPVLHAPYLDHALFDHLSSVPGRFLTDGTFHDEALRRAYPEHAGLGFASAAPPPPTPVLVRHRLGYLLRLLGHAAWAERDWRSGGDRVLGRLLAATRGEGAGRRVSRLLPIAVYLLQLEALTGRRTGAGPW
ncbi:asparagine synthase-related protein [Streptomyces lavendulocolor]|uniref:asparagine synthase (glutamine-hydrolyzing) n=1 Tax=Streptomyces lavendulocolor TaxID=67316 RepID=A0ABV2W972_9ACTN